MATISEYYPFLISRSYDFDYRVIVAPDFMLDRHLLPLLLEATGDEGKTNFGQILHCQVHTQGQGFTVVFRVEVATRRSLQEDSSEILFDNKFRPIYQILGVVCPQIIDDQIEFTERDFEEIRKSITTPYKCFWQEKNLKTYKSMRFIPDGHSYGKKLVVVSLPTIKPEPNVIKQAKQRGILELLLKLIKKTPWLIWLFLFLLLAALGSRTKLFF